MTTRRTWARGVLVLGYSGVLAAIAGFVNSVALLVVAFPVSNLTALTTKLGMDATMPLLYESSVIAATMVGFLAGAIVAGAALASAQTNTGPRHAAILVAEALLLLSVVDTDFLELKVLLAAAACGLQNAMTSSFRGMAIRTTHFTGTITDLGLSIGRSHRHKVDKAKAAVLVTTVALFLVGSAAGAVAGSRVGDTALVLPFVMCLAIAGASMLHARRRRTVAARVLSPAEVV